ncbi:MAG: pro-sigmaK processing inhibitor BofA [Firmicutes bacterium]|nr:pro-sigmaK processing inhibitor BofA [Bacillota bacterium]
MYVATVVACAFGLFLLYVVAYILYVPLKIMFRLTYNAIIGGLVLWLVNLVVGFFGLSVAINPVTALIAGLLGIPGVVLIMALKYVVAGLF